MPISGGKYTAPTWANGASPAINASELQAICDTLAVNGYSTIAAQLYGLINGQSTTLTSSTLNSADVVPVQDTSGTTGAKISVANLQAYIENNFSRLSYGSTDLTAGTSPLTTGAFYAYYE